MEHAARLARLNTALFGRAADYARSVLSDLTVDDLQLPTPCEGWDARRVVLHLADVIDALIGLLETGTIDRSQPPRTHDLDPVARLDERLGRLTHALSVGTDVTRVESAATAGSVELTTHGWDIGVARHPDHRIPEPLAGEVLAVVSASLDISVRGENFAAPVDVPTNASASECLVAFLGRMPWHLLARAEAQRADP